MIELYEYFKMYIVIGIYLMSILVMVLMVIAFIYFIVTLSLYP